MELTRQPQRPQEELEGTLLPPAFNPVSTTTTSSNNTNNLPRPPPASPPVITATAIPVTYYQYPPDDQLRDDEINLSAPLLRNDTTTAGAVNDAPVVPLHDHTRPQTQSQIIQDQIDVGSRIGRIINDEDRYNDKRNTVAAHAHDYYQQRAVSVANRNAVARNEAMGAKLVTRSEEKRGFDGVIAEREVLKKDEDVVSYKTNGGGYEVQEYDVQEYETTEYETTEYKSVYD